MKKKLTLLMIIMIMIISGMIFITYRYVNKTNNTSTKTNTKENKTSNDENNENDEIDFSNYETYDVTLKESYKIAKKGIYILSGTIDNGLITIETDDNVKLILNGVNITNNSGPAINVINAKNVVIETKENTTNKLTDGNNYNVDDDINGCIYSKDDLYFTGDGKLIINSNYEDGIVSKDDIIINSGSIEVNSKDDGIRGKDSITIKNGNITINSEGVGLKVTNEEDENKGYILIENVVISINSSKDALNSTKLITINNGEFNISSSDDGMHSDNDLIINGGNINITKSYEGLEARNIEINNGTINIKSSDDGINATSKTSKDIKLTINGGEVYVNASGDGLDSNGSIYINGGKTIVDGPENDGNGALDYDLECIITNGELLAVGSSGMSQAPGNNSKQYSALINLNNSYQSGSTIEIKDSDNNVILSYTANKKFQSVVYSSNKLEKDKTYTIYINGNNVTEFTINNITTTVGNATRGNMGRPMMRR